MSAPPGKKHPSVRTHHFFRVALVDQNPAACSERRRECVTLPRENHSSLVPKYGPLANWSGSIRVGSRQRLGRLGNKSAARIGLELEVGPLFPWFQKGTLFSGKGDPLPCLLLSWLVDHDLLLNTRDLALLSNEKQSFSPTTMTLADRILRPQEQGRKRAPSLIEGAQINLPCLWLSQTRSK